MRREERSGVQRAGDGEGRVEVILEHEEARCSRGAGLPPRSANFRRGAATPSSRRRGSFEGSARRSSRRPRSISPRPGGCRRASLCGRSGSPRTSSSPRRRSPRKRSRDLIGRVAIEDDFASICVRAFSVSASVAPSAPTRATSERIVASTVSGSTPGRTGANTEKSRSRSCRLDDGYREGKGSSRRAQGGAAVSPPPRTLPRTARAGVSAWRASTVRRVPPTRSARPTDDQSVAPLLLRLDRADRGDRRRDAGVEPKCRDSVASASPS